MLFESTLVDRRCLQLIGVLDSDEICNSITRILTDECDVHASWRSAPVEGGITIREASGSLTGGSRGTLVRSGHGLGGKVLETGRTQYVHDYLTSRAITHDYDNVIAPEGLRGIVAAPITIADRNYGVLFAAYRDESERGDRSIKLIEAVAQRCAEALFLEEQVRLAAQTAFRKMQRRTASALQDRVDITVSSIIKDLRDGALESNQVHSQRLREIERRALDSASQLRRSIQALTGEAEFPETTLVDSQPRGKLVAKREYDVLCRVALGETNQEIAAAMHLSCNTIKTYLRNVMSKLGARNRIEAIVNARELGLL